MVDIAPPIDGSFLEVDWAEEITQRVNELSARAGIAAAGFTAPDACSADTTTSSSYAALGGIATQSHTPVDGDNKTVIIVAGTCFSGASTGAGFAVQINGVDYAAAEHFFSDTTVRHGIAGVALVPAGVLTSGVPYTCTLRWRRYTGAGTPTVSADDKWTFLVLEILTSV
jgi:hypothetical protein